MTPRGNRDVTREDISNFQTRQPYFGNAHLRSTVAAERSGATTPVKPLCCVATKAAAVVKLLSRPKYCTASKRHFAEINQVKHKERYKLRYSSVMHNDEINRGGDAVFGMAFDAAGYKLDDNNKFGFMNADIDMDNIEDLFFAPRAPAVVAAAAAAPGQANEEGLAHNVDDFIDDFLLLAGGTQGEADADADAETMEVVDDDLSWLEDPRAFLSPATSASTVDTAAAGPQAVEVGVEQGDGGGGEAAVYFDNGVQPVAALPMTASADVGSCSSGVMTAAVGISPSPTREFVLAAAAPISAPARAPAEAAASSANTDGPTPAPARSVASTAPPASAATAGASSSTDVESMAERKEKLRRQKVARYLEKKKRRVWSKSAPYKSRQRVANARPRHKGRFLPLESEFVPIAELQRRQRALFKQMQEANTAGVGAAV